VRKGDIMKKRAISLALVVGLAITLTALPLLTACPQTSSPVSGERPQNVKLTIIGFTAGTSLQLRADAVAEALRVEYPDWTVTSLATKGSADNLDKRIAGETDFFFATNPRQVEIQSQGPLYPDIDFEKATAYSVVMPVSPSYAHFFVLGKTGLTAIRDMVDQKYPFTVGSVGGSEYVFYQILEHYSVSWAEAEAWGAKHESVSIGGPTGVEALESGRIDIAFVWSGIPSPPYMGVTFDLRLLPIDDPGLVEMFKGYGFHEASIPAGTYPFVTEDTPTMAQIEALAARPDLPDDVVYYAVKALFNHKDILTAAHAEFASQLTPEAVVDFVARAEQSGLPVHPGAMKFYREMGWVE
jgi:TRAP transporter TAXI family solute receptor